MHLYHDTSTFLFLFDCSNNRFDLLALVSTFQGKPASSAAKSPPVKTMAQVASANPNVNENQTTSPGSPKKTETLPSNRPPNATRPPTTQAPSSNVPSKPAPVITKLVSMTPQENGFVYRNREIVEKLIHGMQFNVF